MALTLAVICGGEGEEMPVPLRLDCKDAIVGRAEDADLVLADERRHISTRHLEIRYVEDAYWFVDHSTNGTVVDGVRLEPGKPRRIRSGEVITIGSYEIVATLEGEDLPVAEKDKAAPHAAVPSDALLLLRHLVRGVIRMIDARSRAKARLGLNATTIAPGGNNPLRLIRSADRALDVLLMPPAEGFMPATAAIDEAFLDFQAHEVATIAATQAALARSLDRLSPAVIRAGRERPGWLAMLFPYRKEAALWRTYEREFEAAVGRSEATFAGIFTDEFKREYYEQLAQCKGQRRSERLEKS